MAADTAEQAPAEDTPPRDPENLPIWDLTVDQAMVMVMREIGAVGKNGTNKEFGYAYRQQEDLVAAARGPMAKWGVRMLPRVIDQKHFQRGKSNVAILTIEYVVRGPAGDVMEPSIIVVGEGADVSDKGSNKAMTAGKKYALVQAFEIAESSIDDGDQTSPDTEASPLDWYVNQLRREDVWYNRAALGRIRQRVLEYGHGGLPMPDDSGLTLLQTIEERGAVLLAVQAEREGRVSEEREARDAQMRAEHPEYHRASPDDEVWQHRPPSTPAPQASGHQQPPTPDPIEVERRLAEAASDPQTAVKRLNELRKHYTPAVLKSVQVQTQWGQVDGNSAITFALKEIAQRPPAPAVPVPAEQHEHQRAAEPAAPSAPPAQPQPAPPAAQPEPQPEPETPSPAAQPEPPAQ
ncbi:ERF family protein, partial [Streptomyces pseudogriseolus]|uniref:ERF family protein n=1 Tax=Streptomyces pseudogriseolus TaxID=36817 RepID=UPI003F9F53D2